MARRKSESSSAGLVAAQMHNDDSAQRFDGNNPQRDPIRGRHIRTSNVQASESRRITRPARNTPHAEGAPRANDASLTKAAVALLDDRGDASTPVVHAWATTH